MSFQAVIFDMDGVLVDTEHFYYKRRETYLASQGISIDHLPPAYFIGGNMKQVWENILGDSYDKFDVPQLQADYVVYKEKNPLPYRQLAFPHVSHVLQGLKEKGYILGLASSSVKKDIERALEELEITSYFDVVLSGEEFEESKPHPEIYQAACRELQVDPQKTLIIEDSEKGIQAGVHAGAEVWAIRDYRFGLDQSRASRTIDHLGQILPLLEGQ
ncbi:HAD family hydrolase [Streptococcus danieliae]|uniref:HAD family hydrolase n=1 Tax=Streptococcus danieliae TaxID=747656 RepID=UPI0021C6D41B|nr:HAD family phosphatase [Streptococcus danieliae]MCU0081734.1 HAD family phosphatase [Streptococcus danieliae]